MRRGLGVSLGKGYYNMLPLDSHIHSLSARGIKNTKNKYNLNAKKQLGIITKFTNKINTSTAKNENVLITIDGNDYWDKGKEEEVTFNFFLTFTGKKVNVIHNHSDNNPPSWKDLYNFYWSPNMDKFIVINKKKTYILIKDKNEIPLTSYFAKGIIPFDDLLENKELIEKIGNDYERHQNNFKKQIDTIVNNVDYSDYNPKKETEQEYLFRKIVEFKGTNIKIK